MVLTDPWALWQAGFWLSFVAVGVLFATDSVAAGAYPKSARGHFYALLREQWVVTLALTPLSLLLFGQVSLVGFAANFLAIPWVTLVVTPWRWPGWCGRRCGRWRRGLCSPWQLGSVAGQLALGGGVFARSTVVGRGAGLVGRRLAGHAPAVAVALVVCAAAGALAVLAGA